MSEATPEQTTAEILTAYRKELIAGGIDDETATHMARDAAGRIVQSKGIRVRASTNSTN